MRMRIVRRECQLRLATCAALAPVAASHAASQRCMAVVLYAVLAIVIAVLAVLVFIICTDDSKPKRKEKVDPPEQAADHDLPDIVAPRRRHIPERGIGRAL
jgi:heme/copper-type cytochrome/quinol oxidase subunit 2